MDGGGINVFHVAAVAPMLGYIGYQSYNGNALHPYFGVFLMILAILVMMAHVGLYMSKQKDTAEKPPSGVTSTDDTNEKK